MNASVNANVLKVLGMVIGSGLVALGNSGVEIPFVPGAILAQLGTLLIGWTGLRQPGTASHAKALEMAEMKGEA